jgi:hypothetical protein
VIDLRPVLAEIRTEVMRQVASRSYLASNELRTAALSVLSGQRSGRVYRVPGTSRFYRASAPGEAPAVRKGALRGQWVPRPEVRRTAGGIVANARILTRVSYAKFLDRFIEEPPGRRDLNRPFVERIKAAAWPEIERIFTRPYKLEGIGVGQAP